MMISWVWPLNNHLLLSPGSSQQPLLLAPVLRHTHTHRHKPTSLPVFQASIVFVVQFSWPQWLVQRCDRSWPRFLVRLPAPGHLKKAHWTEFLESYSLTHHHKPLRCQEKAPMRTKYSHAPKRPSKLVSTCFYHQTSKASVIPHYPISLTSQLLYPLNFSEPSLEYLVLTEAFLDVLRTAKFFTEQENQKTV